MAECTLFTGITGQLGRAIVEHFTAESCGEAACILRKDALSYDMDLSRFKILRADISDREALLKCAEDMRGKVHTLVHMAAVNHGHSKKDIHDTVLKGAINLYDLAREIGCRKYIFLSSILAAGWAPRGVPFLDENSRPRKGDLSYFGKMKLQAEEELLRMAENGMPKVVILRLGNVYGPPTKLSFVKFVAEVLKDRKKIFYHRAKDSVMWAPIYIQDVIDCILLLLKKPSFENRVYFLTGSERATLGEISKPISDALHLSMEDMSLDRSESIRFLIWRSIDRLRAFAGRPSFPDFIYSNKRIDDELGFSPKVDLGEGLKKTMGWALSKELL